MKTFHVDITTHCNTRMNQRGITKEMIYIVLQYGRVKQDCYILNMKDTQSILNQHYRHKKHSTHQLTNQEVRLLKKIMDKGGLVVVEANNLCRTAYNFNSKNWWQFKTNYTRSKKYIL